jgi:K+-sensing histidine kinase KdpD
VALVSASVQAYAESHAAAIQLVLPRNGNGFRTVVIEGRIEQLLDKLLDNAVGFSSGEPVRVCVLVERAAERARIQVVNQGPPLPEGPAALQLFEPMWSQRKRTSERHLGMGLYVARVIAEHHGGAIRARNEPPDRVVFEVTLRRAHPW